jgi:hypothetical protein
MTPISQAPCCGSIPSEPTNDRFIQILEKISAVALGALAFYASFELFVSFFVAGAGLGIFQSLYADPEDRIVSHRSISCSQGLLEQLTGAKLPPIVSLAANLAVTWCHIDHHTAVFVPIIGLGLGAWAGQSIPLPGRVLPACAR